MTAILLRRVSQTIPLLIGLAVLTFLLIRLAPGDPVTYLVGEGASPNQIERVRQRLGLHRPMHEQLWLYLASLAQGDLGESYHFSQPVLDVLLQRLPATLLLMGTQLILAVVGGVVLGVLAAKHWNRLLDRLISVFAVVGFSVPVFWSGMLAILFFSLNLGVLPAQGMSSVRQNYSGLAAASDVLAHLILPASILALVNMALITRVTRAAMVDVLTREYVTVGHAKGLRRNTVVWGHALRSTLLPIVTVIALYMGQMLAGTVVTETVFGWPGIGRLMFESISRRDYPIIMGGFLLVAIGVIIANFLADVVYGLVDPRVRVGQRTAT